MTLQYVCLINHCERSESRKKGNCEMVTQRRSSSSASARKPAGATQEKKKKGKTLHRSLCNLSTCTVTYDHYLRPKPLSIESLSSLLPERLKKDPKTTTKRGLNSVLRALRKDSQTPDFILLSLQISKMLQLTLPLFPEATVVQCEGWTDGVTGVYGSGGAFNARV